MQLILRRRRLEKNRPQASTWATPIGVAQFLSPLMPNTPTQTHICKIRPDKLQIWKDWCREIRTNLREEALKSMAEENAVTELFALYKIGKNYYAVGFMFGIEKRPFKDMNLAREINQKHIQIMHECFEEVVEGEISYLLNS